MHVSALLAHIWPGSTFSAFMQCDPRAIAGSGSSEGGSSEGRKGLQGWRDVSVERRDCASHGASRLDRQSRGDHHWRDKIVFAAFHDLAAPAMVSMERATPGPGPGWIRILRLTR